MRILTDAVALVSIPIYENGKCAGKDTLFIASDMSLFIRNNQHDISLSPLDAKKWLAGIIVDEVEALI